MRIAAYQFAVSGNISENYQEIEKAIYIAKTENVRLLIFPECLNCNPRFHTSYLG